MSMRLMRSGIISRPQAGLRIVPIANTRLRDDVDRTIYTFSQVPVVPDVVNLFAVHGDSDSAATRSLSSATIGGSAASVIVTSTAGWAVSAIIGLLIDSGSDGTEDIVLTFSNSMIRAGISGYELRDKSVTTASDTGVDGGSAQTMSTTLNVPSGGAVLAVNGGVVGSGTRSVVWTGPTEDFDDTYTELARAGYSGAFVNNLSADATYSVEAAVSASTSGSYNSLAAAVFAP